MAEITKKTNNSNQELHKVAKKKKRPANRLDCSVRALNAEQGIEPKLKAFMPRPFVLFGLPHHKPSENEYTRQNGELTFTLVSKAKYGVPHGQDRLFPLLVGSAFAAVGMPENNTFCFRALADVLELFQLPNAGVSHLRVRDWFRRWSHTTVYCDRITREGTRVAEEFSGYRLVNRYQLWSDDRSHPNQYTLFQNVVELDAHFANDLRKHQVPVRLDLVRALRQNSGALDLALWLSYRSYGLARINREKISVPIFGNGGLFEQLGCAIAQPKHARESLKKWLAAIRAAWANCPHELTPDGNSIIVRAQHARPMELPKEFLRSVSRWTGSKDFPKNSLERTLFDVVDNPGD